MNEFAAGDVVMNDDSIYDGAAVRAPYVIIYTSDVFQVTAAPARNLERYTIPFMLIEEFSDWKETLNNLRTHRQAIIDEVFASTGWTADGESGVVVNRVFNLSQIENVLPVDAALSGAAVLPVFLQQRIGVEVETY
jgi:hypothetical protein